MIGGDWANVEPMRSGSGKKMPAGGYVIRMKSPTVRTSRKGQRYIEVLFDVAEGEWKGHYQDIYDRFGFWSGKFSAFFEDKSKGFFKGFIEDVEKTNNVQLITPAGIDEKKLDGLLIGIVLQEEEYMSNSGEIKTRLIKYKLMTADKIREGHFTVPPKKEYQAEPIPEAVEVVDMSNPETAFEQIDAELPF